MKKILLSFIFGLYCLSVFAQQADSAVIFNTKSEILNIGKQNSLITITTPVQSINLAENTGFLVYPDTIGNIDIEQISSNIFHGKLTPLESIIDLYPSNIKQYWIKFELKNQSNSSKFALSLDMWDFCAIYWQDSTLHWKKYESGTSFNFDQRPIKYWNRLIYLPLSIKPNQQNVYYLLLKPTRNKTISDAKVYNFIQRTILLEYESAQAKFRLSSFFFCFYLGIVFILIVYMFVFYLFVRDFSYLFFAIFLLHQGLVNIIESGLGIAFFYSQYPYFESQLFVYSTRLIFVFLFLFIRHFLQLDKSLPRYNKALLVVIMALIGFWLIDYFLGIGTTLFTIPTLSIGILLSFIVNIQCIRQGYKPAIYLLFANIFYIIGVLAVVILLQFPESFQKIPILNLPFHLGSMLQITFFAAGLGYRYNVMRREIEQHILSNEKLVKNQNVILVQKVKEKTFELQEKSKDLQVKNEALQVTEEELRQNMEELETSQELLREQKHTIEDAFGKLHQQNTKVNDSIRYAQRIQNAILPNENVLANAFSEHFIIFKPKDVVSGDFYWYLEVENKKFLAIVDCTGHGVPGAFMSMIGNTLLYEIINAKNIFEPHLILEQLHLGILNSLNNKDSKIQDGMDIALCCIEEAENQQVKVQFSGAKRPLYYFSNEKLIEIQADRKSIGQALSSQASYTPNEITLQSGDTLYMSTDGWIDSINPQRKRFGSQQFKEMLLQGSRLPLKAQEEVFRYILEDYEQGTEQRDDVLLVGVKV